MEIQCDNVVDVMEVVREGAKNRRKASHRLNQVQSFVRSEKRRSMVKKIVPGIIQIALTPEFDHRTKWSYLWQSILCGPSGK